MLTCTDIVLAWSWENLNCCIGPTKVQENMHTFMQSDQPLCYSLYRKFNSYTSSMQTFDIVAYLYSWVGLILWPWPWSWQAWNYPWHNIFKKQNCPAYELTLCIPVTRICILWLTVKTQMKCCKRSISSWPPLFSKTKNDFERNTILF